MYNKNEPGMLQYCQMLLLSLSPVLWEPEELAKLTHHRPVVPTPDIQYRYRDLPYLVYRAV